MRERARQRLREIEAAVYAERVPLAPLTFRHAPEPDGDDGWETVAPGHAWSGQEEAAWYRGTVAVPEAWAGERVALYLDFDGCEPLLYVDGRPHQALDYNHPDALLHDVAAGGERHAFAVECYAPSRGGTFALRAADLVRVDRAAEGLYYDFLAAVGLLDALPEGGREYAALASALDAAMTALDYTRDATGDAFTASLPAARTALREGFFDRYAPDPARDAEMLCAGHSHIDLAYLWAIPNTRKKVGRTFASVLRLMEEYPEYHFTQSSPQLFAYARDLYPDLWEGVKARAVEGRFEPTGGTWVEPDCSMPSGESLIRQFLHGQRFYEREFGRRATVFWQPDVFGCSAALPQIMKGCGIRAFMTTKLSWNQFNRLPADTFSWRGIDGSEVLAHFVTTPAIHGGLNQRYQTYNGDFTPAEVKGAWDEYRQKSLNHELLYLFGHGDGGGGPTRRMLEVGRRLASMPGVPRCSFGAAEPYFARLTERVGDDPRLPRWAGELYLENHRGTLTGQANLKRLNRLCEVALRGAEVFGVLAAREAGFEYPKERLDAAWEALLRNQFHDILPGTCIPPAVAQATEELEGALAEARAVEAAAMDAVAARISLAGDSVVLFNPTDTLRPQDVARVTVPSTHIKAVEFADEEDAPLVSQLLGVNRAGEREYLVLLNEVGPLGYQTLNVGKPGGAAEESSVRVAPSLLPLASEGGEMGRGYTLENEFARVVLDSEGEIVSFVHKVYADEDNADAVTEREVIAPGRTGNALVAYEDRPYAYDGWNVDLYYEDKPYPLREIGRDVTTKVVEKGPVRAGVEIKRAFLGSTLTQRVYLYAHSPRLEFVTEVDWQERQMLLKVAFPVAVNAARATFEIQHGAIERPTHRNTSWDLARFEVCAHRWMDLSEGDYGVSVLNDSKYGCDVHDDVLRLTLIKSGTHPDPEADRGLHAFTYALLPHTGDWRAETVDEAFALNYPLQSRFVPKPANRQGRDLPPRYELATVNDQGIVLDAIKEAEDGDGVIVRLYETFNTRGTATLTIGFDVAEAFEVDMLEGDPRPVEVRAGGDITFDYRPHEVKTFLLKPALSGG